MACSWRYFHYILADCKISLVDYQETKNEMEKLNCKSLMIGDWVYAIEIEQQTGREIQYPIKIDAINTWGIEDISGVERDFLSIEGIPLTPDMLLTNGFELQEIGGDRVAIWTGFGEDNCYDIEVEFDGVKPIHLKIDGPVYLVTPNIKYLHQLQHFLRDCETGKEIEL